MSLICPPGVPEPQKMQFVTPREPPDLYTPLPFVAMLPEKVQFVTVPWLLATPIPPPLALAVLPEKVQFATVEEPVELDIPPPPWAVLPEKVHHLTVAVPPSLRIPPPLAVAVLPEKVHPCTVGEPFML